MTRCISCILPETFPGISFNQNGVCNFCQNEKKIENRERSKKEYKQKFLNLINQFKGIYPYDCIMAYSGGKDSTYTLYLLKKVYNLNILSVTFNNGFISKQAIRNIYNVIENLDIDHMFIKPHFNLLRELFRASMIRELYPPKTLQRASTICTTCMGIIKSIIIKTAIEKRIPFIIYGWSPGQAPINSSIMKNNLDLIKKLQKVFKEQLGDINEKHNLRPYFLEKEHYNAIDFIFYNISPLLFEDYNEAYIMETISSIKWASPKDTDANSTNCLLNSLANKFHKKKYSFHPYVYEMANLVRYSYLERDVALQKIESAESEEIIELVKNKLAI